MDTFLQTFIEHAKSINWEGPAAFVAAAIAVLALLHRWSLVLLVLLIVALGWGAEDLIVFNLQTQDRIASVPLVVYGFGGVVVFVLTLVSLFRAK